VFFSSFSPYIKVNTAVAKPVLYRYRWPAQQWLKF